MSKLKLRQGDDYPAVDRPMTRAPLTTNADTAAAPAGPSDIRHRV